MTVRRYHYWAIPGGLVDTVTVDTAADEPPSDPPRPDQVLVASLDASSLEKVESILELGLRAPAAAQPFDGQLVAFVTAGKDLAPIIAAHGVFAEEVSMGGHDIGDHNMPTPKFSGLAIFEGTICVGPGPDPDVSLQGMWRRPTVLELTGLWAGLMPWQMESSP